MSQETGEQGRADRILEQFERNQFFQGKLMTARDMEAEQEYHAERLHAINRFATGQGILYGAEVSSASVSSTALTSAPYSIPCPVANRLIACNRSA